MKANDHGYVRLMRNGVRKYEHQFVFGDAPGMKIHHINGDATDNRPENLKAGK